MHRTSHWLGMDVHDVGTYKRDGRPRPLEPGMVLTVEPGLYFSSILPGVPEEYRGIGVRIEDDVLVTATGHEVLSHAVPKSADEILALRAG
jgi:Xaa-Pro aminopeptidase